MSGGGDDPYDLNDLDDLHGRKNLDHWNNPNAYTTIPEFGVTPSEVNFKGFGDSVYGHPAKAEIPYVDCLIYLIGTARKLAQKKFKTMKELEASVPRFSLIEVNYTPKQSVALLYRQLMWELSVVSHPHTEPARRVERMASAAQTLLMWTNGEEKAAVTLMRGRNAVNAANPRPNARGTDHEELLKEYWRLVREGHTEREARGILARRGNMGSQSTIYRVTKEK